MWISEKVDGVRVCKTLALYPLNEGLAEFYHPSVWTGEKLLSRTGTVYAAPPSFTQLLPKDEHLDGELFLKRDSFNDTVSIVRSAASGRWDEITL